MRTRKHALSAARGYVVGLVFFAAAATVPVITHWVAGPASSRV